MVLDELELFEDVVVLDPPPHATMEITTPNNTRANAGRRLSGERSVKIPRVANTPNAAINGMMFPPLPPIAGIRKLDVLVIVSADVAVPFAVKVTELGLKLQDAPVGSVPHERLTVPVNPFCEVVVTVAVPGDELDTVKFVFDELSVKFGKLFTRFPMFTEPRPVARSKPTPAL